MSKRRVLKVIERDYITSYNSPKNLEINHSNVKSVSYTHKDLNKGFSKQEILEFVKKFKEGRPNNLRVMLSLDIPVGFRSGKAFNITQEPNFPDDYEWETAHSFIIYFWDEKPTKGGDDEDELNDCLYKILGKIVSVYNFPKLVRSPAVFKQTLGLERDEKVPIELMSQVEDLLKININIIGDHYFASRNLYKMNANISLIDGHYDVNREIKQKTELLKGVTFREKRLIVYSRYEDHIECYDGEDEIYDMDFDDFYAEKNKTFKSDFSFIYNDEKMDLKEFYQYLMEETRILKELTFGRVDLSKSNYNFKTEALKIGNKCLKIFDEPEIITPMEQEWINNSFLGGIIFSKEQIEIENGFEYDKRSCYPSAMSDRNFTFPIKQGEFKQLTDLPKDFVQYGIYRCIIERSGDEDVDKLFRFNKQNFYTHFDLTTARLLKLNIELIMDGEANTLLYTKNRLYGNKVFQGVLLDLFNIRKKSKYAKKILNCVWGQLSSKKKIRKTNRKPIRLNDDEDILEIRPQGDRVHITYAKKEQLFMYNYARLACFLTGKVRNQMATTMYPHRENIHKCHTDGFVSGVEIPELPISLNMGEWEMRCGPLIINKNKKVVFV